MPVRAGSLLGVGYGWDLFLESAVFRLDDKQNPPDLDPAARTRLVYYKMPAPIKFDRKRITLVARASRCRNGQACVSGGQFTRIYVNSLKPQQRAEYVRVPLGGQAKEVKAWAMTYFVLWTGAASS